MNEINVATTVGLNLYAVIRDSDGSGYLWNTSSLIFEAYNASHWANYAIALIDSGGGYYVGNFPTSITTSGNFPVVCYTRAGGSPATSDVAGFEGVVNWGGTTEVVGNGNNLINQATAQLFVPAATNTTLLNNLLIPSASQIVIDYCKRNFVVATYSEVYDIVRPLDTLVLKQLPINSITSVTLFLNSDHPITLPGSDYSVGNGGEIKILPTANNYCGFPTGNQSVQVVYTAGYAVIPADVQLATAMIVGRMYYIVGEDTSVISERTSQYQYTLAGNASDMLTPEVKRLLDPYKLFNV